VKRGWREINPETGEPIAVNTPSRSMAALEAENADLRKKVQEFPAAMQAAHTRITELEAETASLKAALAAKDTSGEAPKGKSKGKAADKPPEGDELRIDTAAEGKAAE
jgi:peptidoglycan hydrolase CwlO-like protein